jgi:hypothetical protein
MANLLYILRETLHLVKKHKYYFLLPILLALVILTILAYQVGPAVAVSFVYAGL